MTEQFSRVLDFLDCPEYKIDLDASVWSTKQSKAEWRKLRPRTFSKQGHMQVVLYDNYGDRKVINLHRLMLLAFGPPLPSPKHFACHINGNAKDNRLENLKWGTAKDNAIDKWGVKLPVKEPEKLPEEQTSGRLAYERLGTDEVWIPVLGFEQSYEISNHTKIRSIPRIGVLNCKRRGPIPYTVCGRELKKRKVGRYCLVDLRENGRGRSAKVSVLMLENFVGPRPEGMVACHDNGNSFDDSLTNLRWDTHTENMRDKNRHGTMPRGENHFNAKLTVQLVKKIRRLADKYKDYSYRQIAELVGNGVNKGNVGEVLNGHAWSWC